MQRIVKTVPVERGKLYVTGGGERYLLADCRAEIELCEELIDVPMLGRGRAVKRLPFTVLITFDHDAKKEPDWPRIEAIGLQGEILRRDGCYLSLDLPRCELLSDIDPSAGSECKFAVPCTPELLRLIRQA